MKLTKPNKALRKAIREGIHRIDNEDYVLLDYHIEQIEKSKKELFDVKAIREAVRDLQHTLSWYHKRGGLLPYDWISYAHPKVMRLLELCKVKHDGTLRKPDKRGAWR